MNCEQVRPILFDYVMEEGSSADRAAIHQHLETCAACSEEAGKCRRTLSHFAAGAAFEDVPQRIRVVAEPGTAATWWTGFWQAPARLAFAASALACIAIALLALARTTITYQQGGFEIVFGVRVVSAPEQAAPATTVGDATKTISREEIAAMISNAVAASAANQSESTERVVDAAMREAEQQRLNDRVEVAEGLRYFQATQMNMWKQQVENQQVVASLMQQQSGTTVP